MIPLSGDHVASETLPHFSPAPGIRVVILEAGGCNRVTLRTILREERDFVLVAECDTWIRCEFALQELLPELLIAGTGLIPAGWSQMRHSDSIFPLVIAVDANRAETTPRAGIVDRVALPLEATAVRQSLSRARSEIFSRKATELSNLLNCYASHVTAPPNRSFSAGSNTSPFSADSQSPLPKLEDILYYRADRNYIRVYTATDNHEVRETMNHLLSRLDSQTFVRMHRSIIVNVTKVNELAWNNGVPVAAILEDGTRLKIGPNYRSLLLTLTLPRAA